MADVSSENYQKFCKIAENINSKIDKIREDTKYSSSLTKVYEHQQFRELTKMGDIIIPYLFHRATEYGFCWVYLILFRELTNECPVPPEHAGKFLHQVSDWVQWYLESKYYPRSDVYYGLV